MRMSIKNALHPYFNQGTRYMLASSHQLFPHQNVFSLFSEEGAQEKELKINTSNVRRQLALAPLHKELLVAFVEALTQSTSQNEMSIIQAIYDKASNCHSAVLMTNATAELQLYHIHDQQLIQTGT